MSLMFMMQDWKEMHSINGDPYLLLPNNLCLALNVDGLIQTHTVFSRSNLSLHS